MATGPKRSPEQREADLSELAHLFLCRHSQAALAARFGVSQQQISLDLRELHKRWRVAQVNDLIERKAVELARIDAIETEAWRAYRRSVGRKRRTTSRRTAGGDQSIVTTWKAAGDERFLGRVAWCIQKRCEILGLDAPKKAEQAAGFSMPTNRQQALQEILARIRPSDANGDAPDGAG